MTPNQSALTQLGNHQFGKNPNSQVEQSYSGRVSPGGTHMISNQQNPTQGTVDSVPYKLNNGDAGGAHQHVTTDQYSQRPSATDSYVSHRYNTSGFAPTPENLIQHQQTGNWIRTDGKAGPGAHPQYTPLQDPYKQMPISEHSSGNPQVQIPTANDRLPGGARPPLQTIHTMFPSDSESNGSASP